MPSRELILNKLDRLLKTRPLSLIVHVHLTTMDAMYVLILFISK